MPNLNPKKLFAILAKKIKNENWKNEKVSNSEKWKLNISRSALLHMKTRVCLKYFVNDCKHIVSVFHSISVCL